MYPLVAVAGPTGSGKSELALRLCQKVGGEVVNCDSLQVYKHFDIGTAKLPPAERGGIPHHLIDVVAPDATFTAGDYAREARRVIGEIAGRRRLPVIAGGTGFYLRALIDGLPPAPPRNECLRGRLEQREHRRAGTLHRLLQRFDARAAERIHPNDVQKLIRAVEVCLLARRPLSSIAGEKAPLEGYSVLKLGLNPNRELLYQRLDARLDTMFGSGLVEEVKRILAMGYSPSIKPFESHGYRQALDVINGRPLSEALADAKLGTRHYAKRQWTWFRREAEMIWIDGFGGEAAVQAAAIDAVSKHLQKHPIKTSY